MVSDLKKYKKIRISYMIPEKVLNDLKENMILQGYDLKGKSKWISEAIYDLLAIKNYIELVAINDQMQGFEKLDSVSIVKNLKIKLEAATLEIRKKLPFIEGVQSKILRTAIIQRLLH